MAHVQLSRHGSLQLPTSAHCCESLYFFLQSRYHRASRKITHHFPLALGAIDANTLAKQRELKNTEGEHDRLQRELDARLNAARVWEAEVEGYYLQARALGLLPDSPPPKSTGPGQIHS